MTTIQSIRSDLSTLWIKNETAIRITTILAVLISWVVFSFMVAGVVLFGVFVLHAICNEHTPFIKPPY